MLNNYISQISQTEKSSSSKKYNIEISNHLDSPKSNSPKRYSPKRYSPKTDSIIQEHKQEIPSININNIEIVSNQTNFEFKQNGILLGQINFDSILSFILTKRDYIISNLIVKEYLDDDFIMFEFNESPIMGDTVFLIKLVKLIEETKSYRNTQNEKLNLLLFKLQFYLLKLLNSIKNQDLSPELQQYINKLTHNNQLYIFLRIQNITHINQKIENIFNQSKQIIDVVSEKLDKIDKHTGTTSQYKGGSSFYKDLISNDSEQEDESFDYLYSADSNNREDYYKEDDDEEPEKKTSDVLMNINSEEVNNIFNKL